MKNTHKRKKTDSPPLAHREGFYVRIHTQGHVVKWKHWGLQNLDAGVRFPPWPQNCYRKNMREKLPPCVLDSNFDCPSYCSLHDVSRISHLTIIQVFGEETIDSLNQTERKAIEIFNLKWLRKFDASNDCVHKGDEQ